MWFLNEEEQRLNGSGTRLTMPGTPLYYTLYYTLNGPGTRLAMPGTHTVLHTLLPLCYILYYTLFCSTAPAPALQCMGAKS
jgi:hypothetical protein